MIKIITTVLFYFILNPLSFASEISGTSIAGFLMSALERESSKPNTKVIQISQHSYSLTDSSGEGYISCKYQQLGPLTPAFTTICNIEQRGILTNDIASFLMSSLEEGFDQGYSFIQQINDDYYVLQDMVDDSTISCYREELYLECDINLQEPKENEVPNTIQFPKRDQFIN